MTRQMPAGAQVAFARDWLERQGIPAETIDVESYIDRSLSYEENIKLLQREFGLGKRGMDAPKVARGMTAAECDVAIGNFEEGYNGTSARDACVCGYQDACEDVERRKAAKAKKKTVAAPKFKTVEDAERWLEKKYTEHGGRWKFQATPEYKKVHPHLLELYGRRNRQIEKERKQVNIVNNPHGTGYVIQFGTRTNVYAGGGGMMGGMATFETVDKAVKEAKRSGYEIMSKPKAAKPKKQPAKPKPKAVPKARKTTKKPAKPKAKKTTTPKLTASQREYLAIQGFVMVKRGGKYIRITR